MRAPVVTIALAVVILGVAWQVTGFLPGPEDVLPHAWSRDAMARGDWSLLVTSAFVHGGILHLAFNLVALVSFGPVVERSLGHARFLALYAVSLALGGIAHALAPGGDVPVVGASGAIFGLLGVMIVILPLAPVALMGVLPMPILLASALYVAAVPVLTGFSDVMPIAHAAHLGGFAAGVGVGAAFAPRRALRLAPGAAAVFVATWFGFAYALTLPFDALLAAPLERLLVLLWPILAVAAVVGVALWDLARAGGDRPLVVD